MGFQLIKIQPINSVTDTRFPSGGLRIPKMPEMMTNNRNSIMPLCTCIFKASHCTLKLSIINFRIRKPCVGANLLFGKHFLRKLRENERN